MYDRNVAVTGCTIEKTSRYDRFREKNIRMELYRIILALYDEGYRMFYCNMNTYIGLLAADTAIMLPYTAVGSIYRSSPIIAGMVANSRRNGTLQHKCR